jgi:hypothetical protein
MSIASKTELKRRIKAALNNSSANVANPGDAINILDNVAEEISSAIDGYVQQEVRRIIQALNTPGAFSTTTGPCVANLPITSL